MKTDTTHGKNLILITVDCLRADHLHCMGYLKNITPTIDALAKNGIMFTGAMANASYTTYSIPSFLTSTLPPVGGNPKETLAGILKKHGYVTAAFNPNPIFSTTMGGSRSTKGFDTYDIMLSIKKRYRLFVGIFILMAVKFFRTRFNENGWIYNAVYSLYDKAAQSLPNLLCPKQHLYIPKAEEINKQAINWIKNQKSKFFIWLHYMDVHEPYAPVNYKNQKELLYLITKYRYFPNMLTKQEIQKLMVLYDLEIEYADGAINTLLKELKNLNCFDNSIIIISADHGDAFGEHETLGHGGKFKPQLYDEFIHVPLIIHGLDENGTIIDRQVQLLDLATTICELVNVPVPYSFLGKSLFKPSDGGIIANSESCIAYRTEKYKLIINKSDYEGNELYDLKEDPGEKINIYDKNQEFSKKMESEMINLLKSYKKREKLLDVKFKD